MDLPASADDTTAAAVDFAAPKRPLTKSAIVSRYSGLESQWQMEAVVCDLEVKVGTVPGTWELQLVDVALSETRGPCHAEPKSNCAAPLLWPAMMPSMSNLSKFDCCC